ncbi:MAG: methyltransferase [Alphaproteobacteria bacterium]
MSGELNPARIVETASAFWASQVLVSATSLNLFTELGDEALTAPELGKRLNLHERAWYDFFDTLVALRFLERDGEGPQARYRNTAETAAFLNKNNPEYVGGMLEMVHDRIYPFWADLTTALKTGEPQNEAKHLGAEAAGKLFDELYADPDRLEQFLGAMAGVSRHNFAAFAEKFDFSGHRSLCDVGGATGLLAATVAKRHPEIECATFDLPAVEPVAARSLRNWGLEGRVKVLSGDFFADPLPRADVLTMGMILHDWNLERKMTLIRKAHEALPEGGVFVAIENLIDDARRENAFGLMMSLNMIVETGDGFDFTGADFDGWCREAGFRRTEVMHLNGPCSAAIAYK